MLYLFANDANRSTKSPQYSAYYLISNALICNSITDTVLALFILRRLFIEFKDVNIDEEPFSYKVKFIRVLQWLCCFPKPQIDTNDSDTEKNCVTDILLDNDSDDEDFEVTFNVGIYPIGSTKIRATVV
jgi:hypothetical protein